MFREELESTIPVRPPSVNRKINPSAQKTDGCAFLRLKWTPCRVANHLNTLTPVGMAIIIVAAVKYARVSTSRPTVNMWWAQTINPRIPIEIIAYIIPKYPKGLTFPIRLVTTCEMIPNPGRINI